MRPDQRRAKHQGLCQLKRDQQLYLNGMNVTPIVAGYDGDRVLLYVVLPDGAHVPTKRNKLLTVLITGSVEIR